MPSPPTDYEAERLGDVITVRLYGRNRTRANARVYAMREVEPHETVTYVQNNTSRNLWLFRAVRAGEQAAP